MAYYLDFDGANDYVSTGYHLDIDFTSDSYEIEFELDFTGSKNGTICSQCIDNSASGRELHLFIASSNFNVWFANAGDLVDTGYRPTSRENLVLSINVAGGSWSLNSDGSPVGSGALSPVGATEPAAAFLIGARHAGNLSSFAFFNKAELYRLKIRKGTTLLHDYAPTASGGTGSILPDIEGGQDGTLINFPSDNSQWVFYSAPSAGVTADITESASDFSESSIVSITANITAQITESLSDFSESSTASFTATLSARVTEVSASFSESSSATITNNLVTLSVTETSQDFSESASSSISGSLSAIITELSQSFTESSTADISANISAVVTELAQDFNESAQVNLTSSFTVEVTETTSDFEDACYIQLPVQRLTPRKTISVSNRSGSTIRVRRRSSVIRVK